MIASSRHGLKEFRLSRDCELIPLIDMVRTCLESIYRGYCASLGECCTNLRADLDLRALVTTMGSDGIENMAGVVLKNAMILGVRRVTEDQSAGGNRRSPVHTTFF